MDLINTTSVIKVSIIALTISLVLSGASLSEDKNGLGNSPEGRYKHGAKSVILYGDDSMGVSTTIVPIINPQEHQRHH